MGFSQTRDQTHFSCIGRQILYHWATRETARVIREMQIKTRIKYHHTPIRMAKIQNTDTPNAGRDEEQQEVSFIAGRNAEWFSHFGKVL